MLLAAAARRHTWLARLAAAWGYVTLGATSIITEEVGPLVGGFAAHQHHLSLTGVIIACAVGTWAATAGLYAIGRWRAAWVHHRWGERGGYLARALGLVRRRPWHSALVVRYAIGARIALPLACGAAHVPVGVYLVGSAVSSITWSALFATLGWVFGEAALVALGHVRRYEDRIAIGIVAAIAIFFLVTRRRARLNAARVIAPEVVEPRDAIDTTRDA